MSTTQQSRLRLALPTLLCLWCIVGFTADVKGATVKVFLLGGQSNADGRAGVLGLPTNPVDLQQPQADVEFFFHTQGSAHALDSTLTTLRPGMSETNQFGPEITFGRSIANSYASDPNTSIAIIKYANGGTNLHTQWQAGGDATTTGDGVEYVTFQNTVLGGLVALQTTHPSDAVEISGMAWMQGESDTSSLANAAAYEANLTAFIDDVRLTYGSELPFLIGQLSINQTALNLANLATVRTGQTNVAAVDAHAALIVTDSFSLKGDNLHFDADGQIALGNGFAAAFQSMAVPEPSAFALLWLGLLWLGFVSWRRPKRA